MKNYVFLMVGMILWTNLYAQRQTAKTETFLPFTIGIAHYQSKDEFHSPLIYSGWGWLGGIGFERMADQHISRSSFSYLSASLNNHAPFPSGLSAREMVFHQHILPKLEARENVNWFIGGTFKISFATRTRDRVGQFDGAATFGITAALAYQPGTTERWSFEGIWNLPLIGWGIRPRFAAISYERPGRNFWGPQHLVAYFPKLLDLDARFNANWDMDNNNFLRFGYDWRYYKLGGLHRVRVLKQVLSISPVMRLNRAPG